MIPAGSPAGAQPGGEQEVRVGGVEDALAHEGRDDVQPGLLAEGAQGRGGLLADDAVAGQHDRPLGACDDLGGAQQADGVGLHRSPRGRAAAASRSRPCP